MNNYKKLLNKAMQEKDTEQWHTLVPQVTRAHNRLQHEALMGGADPNEAYEEDNKNLAFELREEAGKKMAQHNAVVTKSQQNMQKRVGLQNIHWEGRHQKDGR